MQSEYQLQLSPKTPDTAEPPADQILSGAKEQLGFIPNMYAAMAANPGVLSTYQHGYEHFREHSGFNSAEQELVLLAISRFNGCDYCMAAHSMIADKMSGTPSEAVNAIRDGGEIDDQKLAALATFTTTLVKTRGLPAKADVEAFLAAGYQERHVLDIVLAIAVKTLSNFSNHLFHTQVDEAFAAYAWEEPQAT